MLEVTVLSESTRRRKDSAERRALHSPETRRPSYGQGELPLNVHLLHHLPRERIRTLVEDVSELF